MGKLWLSLLLFGTPLLADRVDKDKSEKHGVEKWNGSWLPSPEESDLGSFYLALIPPFGSDRLPPPEAPDVLLLRLRGLERAAANHDAKAGTLDGIAPPEDATQDAGPPGILDPPANPGLELIPAPSTELATPEPSTFLLAAFGLACYFFFPMRSIRLFMSSACSSSFARISSMSRRLVGSLSPR